MTTLRGPDRKSVGKPDAGNRHVRFDERGRETGLLAPRPSSTLPNMARRRLKQVRPSTLFRGLAIFLKAAKRLHFSLFKQFVC